MEKWNTISDYPNYEVSDQGRVRNRKSGRILKTELVKGYPRVLLVDRSRHRPAMVHRLVAEEFTTEDHDGLQVNHIDGDKTNNKLSNLEWVTGSENISHAYRTGLKTPPCPNPRRVRIVETGEEFDTMSDCARHIGGTKTHVYECLDGIRKTHKGYHFEEVID